MHLFKRKSEEYNLIKKSKYFDSGWYLKKNPDVAQAKMDPVVHYLQFGWKEGRNPSLGFNSEYYSANYMSGHDCEICPLVYYEKYGKYRGDDTVDLSGAQIKFPDLAKQISEKFSFGKTVGRVAVFAMFNAHGVIPRSTIYYLQELKKVVKNIILIADCPIIESELDKIKTIVSYCQFVRHNEYDFGSYKRGFLYALENGLLKNCSELIFCNDSCYGPVFPFKDMFDVMGKRKTDFWGICANTDFQYHLQSYFLVFRKNVFNSDVFMNFISNIEYQESVMDVILKYETQFTKILTDAGFKSDSYIPYDINHSEYPFNVNVNLTVFPVWLMNNGCPLVKVKAITKTGCNVEGVKETINYMADKNPKLVDLINQDSNGCFYPTFSVIVPTYNRAEMLVKTLHSILAQVYQNFEVIIVDDGSTDNTKDLIYTHFAPEIENKKIRYFYQKKSGVCSARNYGLKHAKNYWIAYVDSDNLVMPDFLSVFAENIQQKNRKIKTFYCDAETFSGHVLGGFFDYDKLIQANYIDLGMFVHHIDVYKDLGGFDETMTRLVDWDLIARYTRKYMPLYINKVCMLYNDSDERPRISNSADFDKNLKIFRNKHI